MDEAVRLSAVPLVTNQIEYHPYLDQTAVIAAARKAGLSVTAYYGMADGKVFDDPLLKDIAAGHGKSVAQVVLRWLVQQEGVITLSKTVSAPRAAENFAIFDFALSASENGGDPRAGAAGWPHRFAAGPCPGVGQGGLNDARKAGRGYPRFFNCCSRKKMNRPDPTINAAPSTMPVCGTSPKNSQPKTTAHSRSVYCSGATVAASDIFSARLTITCAVMATMPSRKSKPRSVLEVMGLPIEGCDHQTGNQRARNLEEDQRAIRRAAQATPGNQHEGEGQRAENGDDRWCGEHRF